MSPSQESEPAEAMAVTNRLEATANLLAGYRYEFWNYGETVGLEGLLAASELLASPLYHGIVYGALKAWAARAMPFKESDNTAAGHVMCKVCEETGDAQILASALRLAEFLTSRRTLCGTFVAFEHSPLDTPYGGARLPAEEAALLNAPGAGIFVDCVHFDPPFLVHLGSLIGDEQLQQLGAEQAAAYVRALQDESGVFFHFLLERTGRRYGRGWGRGQGWALLGLLDVLEYLSPEHRLYGDLTTAFGRLADALLATQQPNGGWHAIVDDPSSGTEASTAAFAAAGFARGVRLGLLPETFLESAIAAWRATWSQVDADGRLEDVSAAVRPSTTTTSYRHVPKGFVVPWGQAPVLLAAHELFSAQALGSRIDDLAS